MLSMKTEVASSVEEADSVKSIWQEIRGYLTPQRDQIYEAIHSYPPPIPACDVQFNHLLEKRSQLAQELSRLNSLTKQNLPRREQLQLADEFIDVSICLSEEAKQKIRMSIESLM